MQVYSMILIITFAILVKVDIIDIKGAISMFSAETESKPQVNHKKLSIRKNLISEPVEKAPKTISGCFILKVKKYDFPKEF